MLRYTPTCVGKSFSRLTQMKVLWVYSHVCGKKRHTKNFVRYNSGILPRVWEKVSKKVPKQYRNGYTPTCVGKSAFTHLIHLRGWVYSHVCGKKYTTKLLYDSFKGILPLAWEKDLVFMGKTSILSSFCHEIFYKNHAHYCIILICINSPSIHLSYIV